MVLFYKIEVSVSAKKMFRTYSTICHYHLKIFLGNIWNSLPMFFTRTMDKWIWLFDNDLSKLVGELNKCLDDFKAGVEVSNALLLLLEAQVLKKR